MKETNILTEIKKKNQKLEIENQKLKKINKRLKTEIGYLEKALQKSNSAILKYTLGFEQVTWSNNLEYFQTKFGKDFPKCFNIYEDVFLRLVHQEEIDVIIKETLLFKRTKLNNIVCLIRLKDIEENYGWYHIRLFHSETENPFGDYSCFITELGDCFKTYHQVKELYKGLLKEANKELINKLSPTEKIIIKHILEGKHQKEIVHLMKYKNMSSLSNNLKIIFSKAGVDNTLSFLIKYCCIDFIG